jgi:hypothetical protein
MYRPTGPAVPIEYEYEFKDEKRKEKCAISGNSQIDIHVK